MIKYFITDFDGTLVNTKKANVMAYKEAFIECGYVLNEDLYKEAFGLRFDSMCNALGITENKTIRDRIKSKKASVYPKYFGMIELNTALLNFIKSLKKTGVKVAIASTASRENLYAVLKYFKIENLWDAVVVGEDVEHGKPDPEVYNITKDKLDVKDDSEVIVFEDTEVGIEAANKAGINNVIKITI